MTGKLPNKRSGVTPGIYAHSLQNRYYDDWELLSVHLKNVGERAARFASVFGCTALARLAGELHDIGKVSEKFQAYIDGRVPSGGDHSSAGACITRQIYSFPIDSILAQIIAGHHAGLADGTDLKIRLDRFAPEVPANWRDFTGELPAIQDLAPASARNLDSHQKPFWLHFLTRMLFSCLVDADFLATEAFYAEADNKPVERGSSIDLGFLRDRLRAYMAKKREQARQTSLNALRARILDHAIEKAQMEPGLFTLTVPTGGGKTLASLSFALEHAARHGLRRIIYVIPYTSIVEQTAAVFRDALQSQDESQGSQDVVLEHHASFDWESAINRATDDDEQRELVRLRLATQNWDAPIMVTTAVQFFESLFANRTSRCRKLHNIAGSVVVLDEVQTLPIGLLKPCMAAIEELARNYRTSLVLCTATQPALRKMDGFKGGLNIDEARELAPDPKGLDSQLKRVTVERMTEPVSDDVIAARLKEQPQMLCIVNRRDHAQTLFDQISGLEGACHLTTLMCPRHRRLVLDTVRARLHDKKPVRLVATSLIEAGVDVDFPEVWRAAAGIDSLAQAAGRCNREGAPTLGRVVLFEPLESKPPPELGIRWQAAKTVLRAHADPLTLEAVNAYFSELYWSKGEAAFDTAKVGDLTGILQAISERGGTGAFPYKSIAEAFRMIDDVMVSVIVPWAADDNDTDAETLLARIASMDKPLAADLRRLQQYAVGIPKAIRDEWLGRGVLRPVHPVLGDTILRFEGLEHYHSDKGVMIGERTLRAPESNVMS